MNNNPKIVFRFNLVLFAYFCVSIFVSLVFAPQTNEKALWDKVYETFPVVSVTVAIIMGLSLLLWGAKLLELLWNRLISDIFKLRAINFQEALAIVLIFAIVVV